MRIFAVTYTYNDAALASALLSNMLRWPVRPAAVLVVDDGSDPAYAFPPKLLAAYGKAAARGVVKRAMQVVFLQNIVDIAFAAVSKVPGVGVVAELATQIATG